MALNSFKALFLYGLRELYDAEHQLSRALPRFAAAATHDDLRLALEEHGHLTRKHLVRLDRIFERLGAVAGGVASDGMKGLIRSTDHILQEDAETPIRDAGLIASIQRIEHYEIAAYSSLRTFADVLGFEDFAWTLTETLEDEREADQQLASLADSAINLEAAEAPEVG